MKYNKKKTNSIAGKISREKTRKTAAQSNCKDNKRATQSADDDSDCEISLRVLRKEIVEVKYGMHNYVIIEHKFIIYFASKGV